MSSPGNAIELGQLDLRYARTSTSRQRGAIGDELDDGEALVLTWPTTAPRLIHMVGVRQRLTVLWIVNESVERVEELSPWYGWAISRGSKVAELPAGSVDAEEGDGIRL